MRPVSNHATRDTPADSPACCVRLPQRLAAAMLCAMLLLTPAFGQPPLAAPQQAEQQQALEQQKIDYLIASVAALKDASFIRNGKAYDAPKAADHMRLKLRFAGSRVKSAEDFIVYCGTGSSVSGIKYTIRFADGHTVDSATYLRHKLSTYSHPTGPLLQTP
ncbi:DUF5329 family protein [Rhodanobacter ginsengisoli]|uniref:DUF5329 family protein n=1 Tax=Rhodanobacter ginsengisoli TaxID=418646 RepID=A0ABW0QS20_9GAMM